MGKCNHFLVDVDGGGKGGGGGKFLWGKEIMQPETANWKMSDALTHSHAYTITHTHTNTISTSQT